MYFEIQTRNLIIVLLITGKAQDQATENIAMNSGRSSAQRSLTARHCGKPSHTQLLCRGCHGFA